MNSLRAREMVLPGLLVGVLAALPAISIQAANWAEHLEPAPWIAIAAVVVGAIVARRVRRAAASYVVGLLGGLVLVSVWYASYLPQEALPDRLHAFIHR